MISPRLASGAPWCGNTGTEAVSINREITVAHSKQKSDSSKKRDAAPKKPKSTTAEIPDSQLDQVSGGRITLQPLPIPKTTDKSSP
jgi:hypothetical protein